MIAKTIVKSVFLATALIAASSFAVEVDGIVATVGQETILRSDVIEEMRRIGALDPSKFNEIRNEIINRKLILKAARETKLTLQGWVVENRLREIIDRAFNGDRNKLIETLGRQRISYPEWKARIKEDMIVAAMRWNVVGKNAKATPAEMLKAYNSNPEKYASKHAVTVSVIALKPEEASRSTEISLQLKDTDFMALGATKYENINPEDTFAPDLCREIAQMPKGTIGRWIEIEGWRFLVRKDDETAGEKRSFEETYDDIEADVKEESTKAAYDAWIERLRSETYIKIF